MSSDDLDGPAPGARPRAGRHGGRRGRVRLRRRPTSAHARGGRGRLLQADATRCGGITGLPRARRRSREAHELPLSGHCAPALHVHVLLRRRRRCATSSSSTTTCASSACSSTAPSSPTTAAAARPRRGRASASSSSAPTRNATPRGCRSQAPSTPTGGSRARDAARARSTARCASTPARARSTRPTRRTTARCRSAWSSRATTDDVVAHGRGLPRARRADPRARRRHEPRRPVLQRRGGHRLLEVHAPRSSSSTPSAGSRASQPGVVLDDAARRAPSEHGLTFGPDPATHNHCTLGGMIGNNSCGVHSVMAGKTVGQRRGAGRRSPTTALGCASARRRDDELRAIIARRRAARRDLRARLRELARPLRRPDPRALPEDPAPRLRLQPRRAPAGERLPRRARARRHRGHLRHRPRGDGAAWSTARRARSLLVARLSRTSTPPPTTCREVLEHQADRARGHRRPARSRT